MSINAILESGLRLSVVKGRLAVRGSAEAVAEFRELIHSWKPELIKIANGDTVEGAGQCDQCGADLLGLRTPDGYVNRVCGHCGTWHRCQKHNVQSVCVEPLQGLFSKVAADPDTIGDLLPN